MTMLRTSRTTRRAVAVAGVVLVSTAAPAAPASADRRAPQWHPAAKMSRGGPPATTPAAAPRLSQLPGSLLRGQLPITVALAAPLSGTALRVAIAATSGVERAAGPSGAPIRVLVGPSSAQLASAPGPVISIAIRGGRPTLSLDTLTGGHLRLTISGDGDGLLSAARLLSSPAISALSGTSATVPSGIARAVNEAPAPPSVPISGASATGAGTLRVTSHFTLPIARQIVGDSRLELVTAYNSPGGGRVSTSLGGGLIGTTDVPGTGQQRTASKFTLTNDPTLSGATVPGSWAHPGRNELNVTASPSRSGATGTLQVLPGSQLQLNTRPRPPALELALWPFPLYNVNAWSRATVVLDPAASPALISALLSALANTSRVTGAPADLNVALGTPTRAEARENLMLVGAAATQAASGRLPGVGRLRVTQPRLPGVLEEVKLPHDRVALLAYGSPALSVLGESYQLGALRGRALVVDPLGRPHTLAAGEAVPLFAKPRWPWLAPAALLAALVLGWVAVQIWRARRRLVSLAPLDVARGDGS